MQIGGNLFYNRHIGKWDFECLGRFYGGFNSGDNIKIIDGDGCIYDTTIEYSDSDGWHFTGSCGHISLPSTYVIVDL